MDMEEVPDLEGPMDPEDPTDPEDQEGQKGQEVHLDLVSIFYRIVIYEAKHLGKYLEFPLLRVYFFLLLLFLLKECLE